MPWLWALTGNSLLDGHERLAGQISQLHLTASARGRPSLPLQLREVSHPDCTPLACRPPPRAPSHPTSLAGHGEAGARATLFAFCLCLTFLSSPCANTRGVLVGAFFLEEQFSVGLEVRFPLCACLCRCICEPRESE